jgi:uncharacterized protein
MANVATLTCMAQRTVRLSGWPMALLMSVIYTAGMAVVWQFAGHEYSETALLLRDVIVVLGVLVLITLGVAWWSGLRIHRSGRIGWFGLVGAVPVLLILATFVASASSGFDDNGLIIYVLIGTLLVGIGEETAYRGVVLNALASRMSLPWAAVVSAVLFGLMHSVNVILQPAGTTVGQVVTTSLIGLFLGFVYVLSGGNLILVVVLHWLWDFGLIAADEAASPVVGGVGLATVSVLLLAMVGTAYGFTKLSGARWDES